MPYRVLIVEDQEMPRQLFEIFVRSDPRYVHAASISNAELAIDFCRHGRIDLILMDVLTELGKVNWASLVLGFAIVGLEAGNVFLYRAGWKISAGSVVGNISLAIVLLFVGYFLFHEQITARHLIGVAVCAVGLLLITK